VTSDKLTIPKKIHVGYNNRSDTYDGKLAYVIYTDDKGKMRKQKSWDGWRDKKLGQDDYDNEPTEGFVLNKKVGGTNYGWHGRQAKVRAYDPRGFEIEIKVENLLFILEECSAIKGKGLEGEFVYAWDRTDLVLLPVTSSDYQASQKHMKRQETKVTKADMVPGCLYLDRDGKEFMYLGRHEMHWLESEWVWTERSHNYSYWSIGCKGKFLYHAKKQKQHVFLATDGSTQMYSQDCRHYDGTTRYGYQYREQTALPYWLQKGFTKLASRVTDEPDARYADEYEKFVNQFGAAPNVPPESKVMTSEDSRKFSHKRHAKKKETANV